MDRQWYYSIIRIESEPMERDKKKFCKIALGQNHVSSQDDLEELSTEGLEHRSIHFWRDYKNVLQDPEDRGLLPLRYTGQHNFHLRRKNHLQ